MLKEMVEPLERDFTVLVEHPWLASIALFIAGVVLVAAWLMTAWRLGKWYYGRQIELLKAENGVALENGRIQGTATSGGWQNERTAVLNFRQEGVQAMKAQVARDDELLEEDALILLLGHPDVRDLFIELTDRGELGLRTDPRGDRLKWDTWNPPGDSDISRDAALRLLIDDGYVAGMERRGRSDYLVTASEKAKAVRAIYDGLPELRGESGPEVSVSSP